MPRLPMRLYSPQSEASYGRSSVANKPSASTPHRDRTDCLYPGARQSLYKVSIATGRHLHASGAKAHTFTGRYLIAQSAKQAPSVIQPIRLFQSDAHQRRTRTLHKLCDDTGPYKTSCMPLPGRFIPSERICQVQQRIAIQCDISTLPAVLARLINQNKYDGGLQAN